MPVSSTPEATTAAAEDSDEQACSCPTRTKAPSPKPTSLPEELAATEDNVNALKEWLLNYYSASAFNVCEHQLLSLSFMTGETLHLHVDRNATPVAVHKPALVSIHWQDQLYSDLERDFRIGVLERVNQNTSITWCSSKANDTPKRTVDLQPLNRHSVRQAHHVPSPFHLAEEYSH